MLPFKRKLDQQNNKYNRDLTVVSMLTSLLRGDERVEAIDSITDLELSKLDMNL